MQKDKINHHNKFAPEILRICDLLKCPICSDVLKTPIELKCTHMFCRTCIRKYSKKSSFYCPICRKVLSRRSLTSNKDLNASIKYVKSLCSRIRKSSETDSADHISPTAEGKFKRQKTKKFHTFNVNSVFSKPSKRHLTERSAFVMNWLENSHKITETIQSPSVRTLPPRAHNCFCKNAISKPPQIYTGSNHKSTLKQNAFHGGHEIQTVNYHIKTCNKSLSPIQSKPVNQMKCKCKCYTNCLPETTQKFTESKKTQSSNGNNVPSRIVTTACKAISVCDKLNYQKEAAAHKNYNEEELLIDDKCEELIRKYSELTNHVSNYLQRQSSNSAKHILINKCLRSVSTKFMIIKDLINDEDEEQQFSPLGQSKSIQTFCEKLLDATLQTLPSSSSYTDIQRNQVCKAAQCNGFNDKDLRSFQTQVELMNPCPYQEKDRSSVRTTDKSLAQFVLKNIISKLPDDNSQIESKPQQQQQSILKQEQQSPLKLKQESETETETSSIKQTNKKSTSISVPENTEEKRNVSESNRPSEAKKLSKQIESTSNDKSTTAQTGTQSCEDKAGKITDALNVIINQCTKSTSTVTNEPRWTIAKFNLHESCSKKSDKNSGLDNDETNRPTSKSTLHNVDSNILCSSDCPTTKIWSDGPRLVDKSADQASGLLCGGIAIIIPPPASFQDKSVSKTKNRATSISSASEKKPVRGKKKPVEGTPKKGPSKIPKGVLPKASPKKGPRK